MVNTLHPRIDNIEQYCLQSFINGPIRIRFQFVEPAVWECIYVHPSIIIIHYTYILASGVYCFTSHWLHKTVAQLALAALIQGPAQPSTQLTSAHNDYTANEQNQIRWPIINCDHCPANVHKHLYTHITQDGAERAQPCEKRPLKASCNTREQSLGGNRWSACLTTVGINWNSKLS